MTKNKNKLLVKRNPILFSPGFQRTSIRIPHHLQSPIPKCVKFQKSSYHTAKAKNIINQELILNEQTADWNIVSPRFHSKKTIQSPQTNQMVSSQRVSLRCQKRSWKMKTPTWLKFEGETTTRPMSSLSHTDTFCPIDFYFVSSTSDCVDTYPIAMYPNNIIYTCTAPATPAQGFPLTAPAASPTSSTTSTACPNAPMTSTSSATSA